MQHAPPAPCPSLRTAFAIFAVLAAAVAWVLAWLTQLEDPVRLHTLVEDDGPVQLAGLAAVTVALAMALFYTLRDRARRDAYLLLSYLLLFYTLREADYHYQLSPHAKATQFKRFFLHDEIPLYSKLFLAAIALLFLVVLWRYLRHNLPGFLSALRAHLPWAIFAAAWAAVFVLSQGIDQIPLFHNPLGQAWEEVFEATAEVLVLASMILFRLQASADCRSAGASPWLAAAFTSPWSKKFNPAPDFRPPAVSPGARLCPAATNLSCCAEQ